MTSIGSEQIWYNDITVLARNAGKLWPSQKMTFEAQINALTRLYFIITAVGYVMTRNNAYLMIGVFWIILTALYGYAKINKMLHYTSKTDHSGSGFLNYLSKLGSIQEGFSPAMDSKTVEETIKQAYETPTQENNFETPSVTNPLSNVLLTDIQDNPTRKPAPPAYLESVEKEINEKTKAMIKKNNPEINDIDERLFTEVGDNVTFDRGMRQFYSMPNTQIPNDQKGFVEFCYGSMISCKEGNEQACERNAHRHRPGY